MKANDRLRFRTPINGADGKFKKFVFFNAIDGSPAITCSDGDVFEETEQCTGLKDINGRLIYDGDMLLLDPDDPYAIFVWDEDVAMFCLEQEDVCYTLDNCGYSPQEMEVIGNIHENPELLEVKNER